MHILFCHEPFEPRQADSCFRAEAEAAWRAGFEVKIVEFDAIREGGKVFGKQAWQAPAEERGLYRGWMLRVDDYQRLFRAASSRGLALMTSPESYRRCHHLPASYEVIEAMSARSIWTTWSPEDPASDIMDALKVFGRGPGIVK